MCVELIKEIHAMVKEIHGRLPKERNTRSTKDYPYYDKIKKRIEKHHKKVGTFDSVSRKAIYDELVKQGMNCLLYTSPSPRD